MTTRPDHDFLHNWHVAINQFTAVGTDQCVGSENFPYFMYLAKDAADELPRLARLLKEEAEGKLRTHHQQYIHSRPEPLPENHLTCALGIRCAGCVYLKALAKTLEGDKLYLARAWTCVAHLLSYGENIDLSEGFVQDSSDRLFWRNLYDSLANIEFTEDDE